MNRMAAIAIGGKTSSEYFTATVVPPHKAAVVVAMHVEEIVIGRFTVPSCSESPSFNGELFSIDVDRRLFFRGESVLEPLDMLLQSFTDVCAG